MCSGVASAVTDEWVTLFGEEEGTNEGFKGFTRAEV